MTYLEYWLDGRLVRRFMLDATLTVPQLESFVYLDHLYEVIEIIYRYDTETVIVRIKSMRE